MGSTKSRDSGIPDRKYETIKNTQNLPLTQTPTLILTLTPTLILTLTPTLILTPVYCKMNCRSRDPGSWLLVYPCFICFHIMSDWEVNDHLRLSLNKFGYLIPDSNCL